MKLPFTIKLGAVTGVLARLNPKAVLTKLKGVANIKDLIAKVKGKRGGTKVLDGDDLEDLDEDMFGDLGDLDALDAAAKEGAESDAEHDEDNDDDETPSEEADEVPEELQGDDEGDPGDTTLSHLGEMPDFEDDSFEDEDDDEDAERAKKKKLALIAGGGVAAAIVLGGLAWLLIGGGDAPPDGIASETEITAPPPGTSVFNLDEPPAPRHVPTPDAGGLAPPIDGPALALGGDGAPQAEKGREAAGGNLAELGLNVAQEPGAGLAIPSTTKASFAALTPWPPSPPLEKAPLDTLIEQADVGPLPKIADDGYTPFDAYARPETEGDAARPKIAVIVTSMGTSRAATDAALLALPSDVTFALDIYARGLDFWVRKMRESGHEVLLEMPSESALFPFKDLGPSAMQALVPLEENVAKLEFILSRTTGYFGLLSIGGGKFLTNEEQVQSLMLQFKARGLMYVDGGVEGSMGPRLAYKEGIEWAAVELELDKHEGRAALLSQLAEAEALAQKRALTVVRITSTPLSMAHLSTWIYGLEAKGIRLVPVSALSKKQLVR